MRIVEPHTVPEHLKHVEFYRQVWNQVHVNGSQAVIAVTAMSRGHTGIVRKGKSSLAIKFGTMFDVNYLGQYRFTVDNVVASIEELSAFLSDKHPRGTVVMMEEVQNWFNVRTSMTKENMEMIRRISTGGYQGYIFVMTCPRFEDIDKQIRQYINWECLILERDNKNRKIIWTPLECSTNYNPLKPIWKQSYNKRDGGVREKLKIRTSLPPAVLMKEYEEKIYPFKKEWQEGKKKNDLLTGDSALLDKIKKREDYQRKEWMLLVEANNAWDCKNPYQVMRKCKVSYGKAAQILGFINDNTPALLEKEINVEKMASFDERT